MQLSLPQVSKKTLTWRHCCSAKLKINELKILPICRLESALIDHDINQLLTVRFTAHQQENTFKGHTLWTKTVPKFFYCSPWLKMKCPRSQKPYLPINKQTKDPTETRVKDNILLLPEALLPVHGSDYSAFFRLQRELRVRKSLREKQGGITSYQENPDSLIL